MEGAVQLLDYLSSLGRCILENWTWDDRCSGTCHSSQDFQSTASPVYHKQTSSWKYLGKTNMLCSNKQSSQRKHLFQVFKYFKHRSGSTNQWINQWMNQWSNKPSNQETNEWTNQPTNQSELGLVWKSELFELSRAFHRLDGNTLPKQRVKARKCKTKTTSTIRNQHQSRLNDEQWVTTQYLV